MTEDRLGKSLRKRWWDLGENRRPVWPDTWRIGLGGLHSTPRRLFMADNPKEVGDETMAITCARRRHLTRRICRVVHARQLD